MSRRSDVGSAKLIVRDLVGSTVAPEGRDAALDQPVISRSALPDWGSPEEKTPSTGTAFGRPSPGRQEQDSQAAAARALMKELRRYSEPSMTRSIAELVVTLVTFVILWTLIWFGLQLGFALVLVLALPAAGLLLRLFIIQHDCGHGAFFKSRRANDWLGHCLGVLTLTPYAVWRHAHARHHATSGNLDQRGIGDIDVLTVNEFQGKTGFQRLCYRIYRHPAVMFGVGPAYLFLLRHRLPIGQMWGSWKPWASTFFTNAAIVGCVAGLGMLIGFWPFVAAHLPITMLAASFGVWLFYVQHQYEETVWEKGDAWTFHASSLHGSSYYDLPRILHWFTGNIGFHHVHHLVSRIPFYRLPEVIKDRPELGEVGRVTMMQSLRCVHLALWDEQRRRLVSFSDTERSHSEEFAAGKRAESV